MRLPVACAALILGLVGARADDGLGLRRGGDPGAVSISGLSSGAAMAVQYAVAHSAGITGVGAVAGPLWGCANGSLSRAVDACLCLRQPLPATAASLGGAHRLAEAGRIDALAAGRPRRLARAYVFHSAADATVAPASGEADAAFLGAFIGSHPEIDRGEAADGSDRAGHGIVSPEGGDTCTPGATEGSYVRRCGGADTAGRILRALHGAGTGAGRIADIPDGEIWTFDQAAAIDAVRAEGATVTYDGYSPVWLGWRNRSPRRERFDMAPRGHIYVPPGCRGPGRGCRVHVALHGCKQDARRFAREAGYNNWAEHHRTIVVYPALAPGTPVAGAACALPVAPLVDASPIEPNPNGCWDWWGYLDGPGETGRYLTRRAPQMQVLEGIIAAVTAARE